MSAIYIYTNRANNDLNNRNLDTLLKIFKSHKIRCENDEDASVSARIHFNYGFGLFKDGMEVLELSGDFEARSVDELMYPIEERLEDENFNYEENEEERFHYWNNKRLFNIKTEMDITDFTREELALIYQVKIVYATDEYKAYIGASKENGRVIYTELTLTVEEENRFRNKADTVKLRKNLLKKPYLIHTLRDERELDDIRYGSVEEYKEDLLDQDGSVFPKLFYRAHDIEEAEMAIYCDYANIGSEALEEFTSDKRLVSLTISQKKYQGWSDLDDCFILSVATELNGDKEVVEKAVAVDNKEFAFASEELRSDKDFILYLLDKGYFGIVPGISKELDTEEFKELLLSRYPQLKEQPDKGIYYAPVDNIGSFDILYHGLQEIYKKAIEQEFMKKVLETYKQFNYKKESR